MNKQVLQFILEEENPNGIIECSVDDWFGISYKIPRNKLKEASSLEYINNTGVYILFGDDENTAEKIAYIGEAEDIYNRLSQHNKNKDFWNECIVFVSKDNSLNKAHIKYIEHELYEMSKKANRYIIKNESNPTKSSLSNADEISIPPTISVIQCTPDNTLPTTIVHINTRSIILTSLIYFLLLNNLLFTIIPLPHTQSASKV